MSVNGRAGRRLAGWAALVTAVTIILAVGGPLVGRGVFIAVDAIRKFPPWNAETPTDFRYSHGPVSDTVNAGTPARVQIREGLVDDRRMPLWDPHPNGGTPLGSHPGAGLLSPLNWPELVLGVELGAAWAALLRFAVAAFGTYWLLRWFGVSRFAAICAGLIYSVNGFLIFWNNFPQGDIAAMLPLLFLTGDVLRVRRRPRDVVVFALVIATLALEGYPPLVLVSMYALAAFLAVRWWESAHPGPEQGPSLHDRLRRLGSRLREAVSPIALLVAGGVLGAAVAAFQLLPFAMRLGVYDTSYRAAESRMGADAVSLLVMLVPWAWGKPEVIGNQPLFNVFFDSRAYFLGAAAIVFVIWGLVMGRPEKVSRGIYRYCVVGAAVLLLALVRTEPAATTRINRTVTAVLFALPGMGQVPISRLVALLIFLLTLIAAFGIEHVVATATSGSVRVPGRWRVRVAVVGVIVAYCAYAALRSEQRFLRLLGGWSFVREQAVVPALLVLGALLVIVVTWRARGAWRSIGLAAIPVLLAIETLIVAVPVLPRAPNADFYPENPAIRYLQRHLGTQRFAGSYDMLFQSTNSYYGLRSVTGHSFSPPGWQELIASTSPRTFESPTHTLLAGGLATATSPVLDQLSARYFITQAEFLPFGRVEAAPRATGTVGLRPRRPASGSVAPGPLRGIGVTVEGPEPLGGTLVYLDVAVRDSRGAVVARGSRRMTSPPKTKEYFVPVAGEHLPAGAPLQVQVSMRSNAPDHLRVATTPDGQVALSVIRPADDGLELVHADAGAAIYRRHSALPRIRWASRAEVVRDPKQRVRRIAAGALGDDTVMLDRPGPPARGGRAAVVVDDDSADRIHATVHARTAGYLVVADAIQEGWSAQVDGRDVELRNADHAVVAIPVPAGTHAVTLVAAPPGWHAGIVVTAIGTLVVVLLCVVPVMLRRRARRRDGAADPEV